MKLYLFIFYAINDIIIVRTKSNVSYYQRLLENRAMLLSPQFPLQLPLPTSGEVLTVLDLLDAMTDAMYIQLKDFRAKQYSYEGFICPSVLALIRDS